MAKKPPAKPSKPAGKASAPVKKEVIKPPAPKVLPDASQELRKGHPAGGRALADQAVAVKQKVAKRSAR